MEKIYVWRLIFLIAIIYLVGILARPSLSLEGNSWTPNSYWDFESYPIKEDSAELPTKTETDYFEDKNQKFDKRGFSMLARWKPFNIMGKHRTAIRDINRAHLPVSQYDIISAETRAYSRPGQPLRWG